MKKFVKREKSVIWTEILEIYDDKTATYYSFIPFPICEDGYKDEIMDELEKRGCWKSGLGGLIYKEKIQFGEILDCIIFTNAYRKTYEFLTEADSFIVVPLKVAEFINLIETKATIERKYNKQFPKELTWENLERFLEQMGFSFVPNQ